MRVQLVFGWFLIFINYFVTIGSEYLTHMWGYICPELLQAIESEPEPDVSAEMYDALGKVIYNNNFNIIKLLYLFLNVILSA